MSDRKVKLEFLFPGEIDIFISPKRWNFGRKKKMGPLTKFKVSGADSMDFWGETCKFRKDMYRSSEHLHQFASRSSPVLSQYTMLAFFLLFPSLFSFRLFKALGEQTVC